MRFAEKVYRSSEYPNEQQFNENPQIGSNLGEIGQDFIKVKQALEVFPYRSALTVVGGITVLYIGFKIVNKCVNMDLSSIKNFWS